MWVNRSFAEDDGEQLRQPSETELAELSEKLREKEDSKKTESETEKPMEEKEEEAVNVKNEVDDLVTKEPKKIEVETAKKEERKDTVVDDKKEATISDVIEEHEFIETEPKEEEPKMEVIVADNEVDKISWDLVQFMLMLLPSDKEVSWWTIIVESVKVHRFLISHLLFSFSVLFVTAQIPSRTGYDVPSIFPESLGTDVKIQNSIRRKY